VSLPLPYRLLPAHKPHHKQNQDTLKTRPKCLAAVRAALSSAQSCVVDNTSPARSTRKEYLDLVRQEFPGTKIRILHFTAHKDLCVHNSLYRAATRGSQRDVLPLIAFSTYFKNLEEPKADEGEFLRRFSSSAFRSLTRWRDDQASIAFRRSTSSLRERRRRSRGGRGGMIASSRSPSMRVGGRGRERGEEGEPLDRLFRLIVECLLVLVLELLVGAFALLQVRLAYLRKSASRQLVRRARSN
jgi:gluconate kinase